MPATVRDAVLARAARLRPSARAILDAAAVAGPRIEPWLLEDVVAAESRSIDECLASGVLAVQDGDYQFRHELARQTVLEALTPTRRLALHRLVLQALRPQDAAPRADPARLAHHAVGACDEAAILRWAPAAAREAAARGAHRQAAQQLERALGATPPGGTLRATLLDDLAAEQQFCGRLDAAIAARTEAAAMWRAAGDAGREAQSLARLAHSRVIAGQNAAGEAALDAARRLVRADDRAGAAASGDAPSPALLAVRRWSAYVRMLDRDVDAAIAEGEAALAAAEALGDDEAAMQCLNTIGSSLLVSGRIDAGRERLDRSRERAERLGADQWILNAWSNLGSGSGEAFAFDVAESALLRAIEYCAERDLDSGRLYSQAWLATVYLYRGRWQVAGELANAVATDPRSSGIARMMAHIALGRLRARRGDPGVGATLDEALRLGAARDPSVLEAKARVRAEEERTRAIGAEMRPDLFLTTTFSGRAGGAPPSSGPSADYGGWVPYVPNWDVGLVLSWPILDATVLARKSASRAREDVRREELALARRDEDVRVREAWLGVEIARVALPALERAVVAAQANWAQADARFKSGLGTSVEIADAEDVRASAEVALALGRFGLARAQAGLGRAIAEAP